MAQPSEWLRDNASTVISLAAAGAVLLRWGRCVVSMVYRFWMFPAYIHEIRAVVTQNQAMGTLHLEENHTAQFRTDAQGRWVWACPYSTELTGYTLDELRGYGWMNAIPDVERYSVRHEMDEAIKDSRPYRMEHTITRKDGKDIDVVGRALPIMDGERLVAMVGVIRPALSRLDKLELRVGELAGVIRQRQQASDTEHAELRVGIAQIKKDRRE